MIAAVAQLAVAMWLPLFILHLLVKTLGSTYFGVSSQLEN